MVIYQISQLNLIFELTGICKDIPKCLTQIYIDRYVEALGKKDKIYIQFEIENVWRR